MARRVVLHVGAMKSGTTYLQGALYANRSLLRERGILVAGERWRQQVDAVLDLRGRAKHPTGDPIDGAWERLVAEVDEWDGVAVISVELLAPADEQVVERVASSFAGVTPEIVLSVRDLNRSIPAMWQELIQNGQTWTWPDFLKDVRKGRPGSRGGDAYAKRFWDEQDQVGIARRWGQAGPLHLVTVPPPGAPSTELLARFGSAIGFDAEGMASPPPRNASLGAATSAVLRSLNEELAARGLVYPVAMTVRKHTLAKGVMPRIATDDPRIGLKVQRWVRSYTRDQHKALSALDCRVHGDLADLEPVDVGGIDADDVSDQQVLAAAVAAYRALRAELAKGGGELPEDMGDPGTGRGAVERAVDGLADLVEWSERREPAHA